MSICESAKRPSKSAMASGADGMTATRINNTLAGMCVQAMVRTSPMWLARWTETSCEKAESTP